MDKQRTAPVDHTPGWPRAAIYFAPAADSALHDFRADRLGRDALIGAPRPTPTVDGIAPERLAAITADARRYGFTPPCGRPFIRPTASTSPVSSPPPAFGAPANPLTCRWKWPITKAFWRSHRSRRQPPWGSGSRSPGAFRRSGAAAVARRIGPPAPSQSQPGARRAFTALGLSICAGPVPFSYDLDHSLERPGGAKNAVRRPARARRAGARGTASR